MIKESKGNMYEFVTHTWNPIKGKCFHGCTYCYMKKMCSRLKAPRLDAAELTSYLECSNFILQEAVLICGQKTYQATG